MAYTINLTNGTIFATIADGTINTSSSMTLVGKNYAGYGEFLDENFIHLLENGANSTSPGNPLDGQLWFDTSAGIMKVYNGTTWKTIGSATASSSAPSSNVVGDLWYDTANGQLKVWSGSTWILVGPASTSGQGTSGAIVETISDGVSNHTVVFLYVGNTIVGTVSKDPTFTPSPAIPGFTTISPGIQISSTPGLGALFVGTATDSQLLDGLDSASFLRSDANDTTSGTLGILNDLGLTVGAGQQAKLSVTTATNAVNLENTLQNGNLNLLVNDGGVRTTVMAVNGATSQVTFPTTVGVTGIINNNANATGNIGNSTGYFNTIFATATTALYADVAERFAADTTYQPGTVVELGGDAEITISTQELSENVFGVISTRAAYLMNAGAGTDETHPPIAMTGRVPVRVIGAIRKGDRLVSAGQGLARAALPGEATPFNVIGRSLVDRQDTAEGTIEAIVMIN